jgi:hypothetical protein
MVDYHIPTCDPIIPRSTYIFLLAFFVVIFLVDSTLLSSSSTINLVKYFTVIVYMGPFVGDHSIVSKKAHLHF